MSSAPRVPSGIEDQAVWTWANQLMGWIIRELQLRPVATTPSASVLIHSPNKDVYEITVSDLGAITATKIKDA